MKRFLLALFIVVGSLGLNAQWVQISDANFLNKLIAQGYGACLNGNLLDTTCNKVLTDTLLDVSNPSSAPDNLKILDLNAVQYFKALRKLNCNWNRVTILPTLSDSLRYLYCEHNLIFSLPPLPSNLLKLFCDWNQLISLPFLSNSLLDLECGVNQLTSLPALPASLIRLSCTSNQLVVLPPLPTTLKELYCGNDHLTTLPTLPITLTNLGCQLNQLTSLPPLPVTLKQLYCYRNQLTSLPVLPDSMFDLNCSVNQLTSLPPLPASLRYFDCGSNQLPALFTLPDSLIYFSCSSNQITNLPSLPTSLQRLWCSNNQLNSIPELPDFLQYFYCNGNPNLACLPQLKRIWNFRFDSTSITCLPNYPLNNLTSTPLLSSVPLCGIFNNSGCPVYWNISGKIYNDSNNNCVVDWNESGYPNFKIMLDSAGALQQQLYSSSGGFYSFETNYGTYTYTVDTIGLPVYISCPINGIDTSVISFLDSLDNNRDFAMRCRTGFDVGAWSAYSYAGQFRPNSVATVRFSAGDYSQFFGANCASGIAGQVTITFSGPVTYYSNAGAITPANITGNTFTWNISDFGNVNVLNSFALNFLVSTFAQSGQQVCFTVTVTPTAGDNNPANNTLNMCFAVINSYDPNIKEVYPAGDIDTAQDWLTYTIHFQNTGTAEAQHIYVDDTLDTDLDASSFQLLGYSHQPLVQIKQNTVRFNFPNINLPDSNTNEPLSHGYVQYKIKLKDNLPLGTTINNTAFIYFDFNAPVVTNTTTNTIVTATGVSEIRGQKSEIRLYPNPTNTILNIQTENFNPVLVAVFDINGKKILEQKYTSQIDVSLLTSGIYFIELKGIDAIARKKFVKM